MISYLKVFRLKCMLVYIIFSGNRRFGKQLCPLHQGSIFSPLLLSSIFPSSFCIPSHLPPHPFPSVRATYLAHLSLLDLITQILINVITNHDPCLVLIQDVLIHVFLKQPCSFAPPLGRKLTSWIGDGKKRILN